MNSGDMGATIVMVAISFSVAVVRVAAWRARARMYEAEQRYGHDQ